MVTLSAKNTISVGGCGQVFCFSVGIRSTSEIDRNFLLSEEDCSGGAEPLGWLSSTTTGGCFVPLPLSKLYWLEVGEPSSLKRRCGDNKFNAFNFFTYRITVL